ncbi:VWA domain-containing protein [Kocuria marina]|uniref:VWA domain-containing protein n=1 Tax=Kocuria marina TaxID=223184 RepID=UPI0022E28951|nr:VWA domain-containing protein [Kocuria marina]
MTDPGKPRDRAAHRAERSGPSSKLLLWAALAMAALLLLVAAIFWFPRNGDDAASVSPTDGAGSGAATGTGASGEANDDAQAPVVVGHANTRAGTWSAVLADPAVELGRPSEDAGTRGLISRALWEAQDDRANRSATDEALKLRARTEGDAAPVLAAPERLQQLADHPSPEAPASPENAAVAAGAASGGPQPNATVVTRAQWDEYHSQHPDTPLVASTPGDRPAADPPAVDDDALKQALGQWAHLAEPFHALVAIDVSGSMGAPVSPDGATRMDLTKAAATTAVTLFPEHDALGVWAFGHRLDGDKDYREITPVREMAAPVDGVTQRERLAQDAQALSFVPKGYTGLYDTTLAAFRKVLDDDAPDSLKTVIILTDGIDQDPDSQGLDHLLAALESEQDPSNPVRIITVGISQDADEDVLRRISEATGGTSHIARAPEDIQEVFVQALTGS